MTYKEIVRNLIETEAERYTRQLLTDAGIEYLWIESNATEMKFDGGDLCWKCEVQITRNTISDRVILEVGGYTDSLGTTPCSVWGGPDFLKCIWTETKQTRETFGIREFKLP